MDFPVDKESACSEGDAGLIPGLGRSPGEGNGNTLLYSLLGKCLAGYSPWDCKESDMTEQLNNSKKPLSILNLIKMMVFRVKENFMGKGSFEGGVSP